MSSLATGKIGLALLCAILTAGCGAGESSNYEEPAYAVPSYTRAEMNSSNRVLSFTDITESAGIDFVHENGAHGEKWMPETMGSGGGLFDYDGDGWLDVLLINGNNWPGHERANDRPTMKLYRNLGNATFSDVTSDVGLDISLYGMGTAIADYDGDGDLDIFVSTVGENKLFRNEGEEFIDVAGRTEINQRGAVRLAGTSWSTAAAWLDYDRDGWADLFVCNYVRWAPETDLYTTLDGTTKSYATPEQYEGESCELLRNMSGQRFEDVSERAGVFNPNGKSLGIAVTDLNNDGWVDIVVANDTEHNFLYINNSGERFDEVAVGSGVGYDEYGRARAGMGIDVADVGNDGGNSIVIGNFSQEPLSLFSEVGNGLFQDRAGNARISGPSLLRLTFGVLFVDLNLDGMLDIVAANGHIEPTINDVQQSTTFAQPPQLFLNSGDGTFSDVSSAVGSDFAESVVGRGLAYGDIDRDGDLDLLMTVNGGRPKLLRNDLPPSEANSIVLEIRGAAPNTGGLGAVVTVFAGNTVQRRMVRSGSSYLSHSDFSSLVFGLGDEEAADSIQVRWPGLAVPTNYGNAESRFRYVVVEGESLLREIRRLR